MPVATATIKGLIKIRDRRRAILVIGTITGVLTALGFYELA